MAKWKTEGGPWPGSDMATLREHVLEPLNLEYAILTSYMAIDSMRYPDYNVALARANNDWLIEEWLSKDSRLRATMVLPSAPPNTRPRRSSGSAGTPGSCRR